MNPNYVIVVASLPSAAAWPLLGPADEGEARFSRGRPVYFLTSDTQVLQYSLKAPRTLLFLTFSTGAARSWTSAVASRNSRPHRIADALDKDENAEFDHVSPQTVALAKKYVVLEGCSFLSIPSLSPQNSRYSVHDLQNFLSFLDLPGGNIWKLFWMERNDRFRDLWTFSSSPLKPL